MAAAGDCNDDDSSSGSSSSSASASSAAVGPQHAAEQFGPSVPQAPARSGAHYGCMRAPCTVCARLPLSYRGLLHSLTLREGRELWDLFDAGYFELVLGGAGPAARVLEDRRRTEPRVDLRCANRASEKALKHLRKLQLDLAEMGLLRQLVQKYTGDSDKARIMAPFDRDELVLGRRLGTGGFSAVYEVLEFRPETDEASAEPHRLEMAAREFLMQHVRRKPQLEAPVNDDAGPEDKILRRHQKRCKRGPLASYAVKHLKYSLVDDPDKYAKAAVDLALEAQLLLVLDHPNIIGLRGWARDGAKALRRGFPSDYFIILDRLPEILDDRIYTWKESLQKYRSRVKVPWLRRKFSAKIKNLFIERISVAHDVAAGLEHMHERRIINRDLKTSNIGFDFQGEVKVFDLGLSRLMPKEKYKLEDGYIMSRVGTKATMAPEVRCKQPYDLSADVYSYGIVLWEILSLATSTDYIRSLKKDVRDRLEDEDGNGIFDEEALPLPICACWPKAIQALVQQCLMYNPKARPSMKQVRKVLATQMEALGVSMTAKHRRRRSTLRLDLSKFGLDEMDDFSRTSLDSSLQEPGSITDFGPLGQCQSSMSASLAGSKSSSDNPAEEEGPVASPSKARFPFVSRMADIESSESYRNASETSTTIVH